MHDLWYNHLNISIHALREEGDRFPVPQPDSRTQISIHALREEGDWYILLRPAFFLISIHALREEGDAHEVIALGFHRIFLSTPSARRATGKISAPNIGQFISIHALREEGDST